MIHRELGGTDKAEADVLLRLFKLVFGSVTLFAENEPVLQPHLALIITSSIKYAGEVKVIPYSRLVAASGLLLLLFFLTLLKMRMWCAGPKQLLPTHESTISQYWRRQV